MKGMKARYLLVIALVLGIVTFACPVLGQTGTPATTALWPTYHYDMYRGGQNKDSKDIKDPSTLKAIWAFPRADAGTALPDQDKLVVDDASPTFSATGLWRLQNGVNDAIGNSYHITDVIPPGIVAPDPRLINVAKAVWPFPAIPLGRYQVFIWVPAHRQATTAAVYTVTDDYGSRSFTLNQASNSDTWALLTNTYFTFTNKMPNEGVGLTAQVTQEGASGNKVLADAVEFVPAPTQEIYSSPVSANIPCTLTDPDDTSASPPTIYGPDRIGTCVYTGTVEQGQSSFSAGTNDKGAIYCIYSITPTIQSPRTVGTVDTPNTVTDAALNIKISKYLGKPKWRYPRNGADVNNRDNIEGPIAGGVFSSPTLATISGPGGAPPNDLVCFATGMSDRQLYALDAVNGHLLWKGPGFTVGEEDDAGVVSNWTLTDTREDAFGGKFHYIACVDGTATPTKCTWNFSSADQANVAPTGADGLSYNIYAWIPEAGGTGVLRRSRNATYVISYPKADNSITQATVTVNQSDPSTFGTWVRIGSSYFNPTKVELQNTATPAPPSDPDDPSTGTTAADYAVIADAVMFVPDTVDGMGYSTPITNANTIANPTDALATSVFTVTATGRVLSFDVKARANKIGQLNWIYPAVRMKAQPKSGEVDLPGLGSMSASPAYASNQLFIAGMNGVLTCLTDVEPGSSAKKAWDWTVDTDTDASGGFTSSPALDPDESILYLASSGGHIYCLYTDGRTKDTTTLKVGEPVWQYPAVPSSASDPVDNPLGSFRYSTPAVALSRGVKRIWCASSDGHIYSFIGGTDTGAGAGTRLFTDDTGNAVGPRAYDEPSFGLPVQGSVALDGETTPGDGSRIMYVGDMGDRSGTLHWREADNGQVNAMWSASPSNTVPGAPTYTQPYEGWTAPGVLFSSPNITHLEVQSSDVSYIFIGCGDGHLLAFSRAGGAWGGEWQGGTWPFPGNQDDQNAQRTTAAPITDVQFDVFKEQFFNDSLNFDPEVDKATYSFGAWPTNVIVKKEMKLPTETDPLKIDDYLTGQAKLQRTSAYLADSRVNELASGTVFYEWGEKIYCIVWNLPESKWLDGSSIADKVKPRMTNQSCGESAGATSGGQTGNVNGLVMQVRAIKDYTCLKLDSTNTYTELPDADSKPVRRSYCLISIDIDGSRDRPPGPGPGWTLYVDIEKKTTMTTSGSSATPTIHQTIPLAKLTQSGTSGYNLVIVGGKMVNGKNEGGQIREAPLGINNPLAIRDDGIMNEAPEGNVSIAWAPSLATNIWHPDRRDENAHLNGNFGWVSNNNTANNGTQPYNFTRLPTPMIYLQQVVHGTSSREAPLGIADRSAMGIAYRKIPRFRLDARDLTFRGELAAIECAPLDPITGKAVASPTYTYGFKFPWDLGLGSIDYPNIYTRYQSYQLISTDIDPSTKASDMLAVTPDPTAPTHETSFVRPDTVLVSVDVPRFQPANETKDYTGSPGGYSRTMIAYVDSNNSGILDSGNTNRGRPTTWQESYRTFRVEVKVPPDPKLLVDEQLIDIGRAPHGLGQNMTGALEFTAYNKNPLIQQWFKPITIRNGGNVNLYNIRLDQVLGLLGDQASPSQQLPGIAITSSLNIYPPMDPLLNVFGADPFLCSTANDAAGLPKYLGYTLSKPRVGDVDPTVMTIPDRRRWDNAFSDKQLAQDKMSALTYKWDVAQPLPVLVSVQVPLTQPVGTYQSWDSIYRMPYVSVFSDQPNRTASVPVSPRYGEDPMAVPSFQLKLAVRENQLTGGATPTTLPQIDYLPDGTAPPELIPKYGDSTPAAYRDANNVVHLFWSSNRLDMTATPPTTAAELANFASAPWLIHEAQLGYAQSNWVPANPMHWWFSANKMPAFKWPANSSGEMPMVFSGSGATTEYSVRHFSPSIGENLALSAAASANRTWITWAGTADFRDPANKVRQENLIFYTDITPNSSASSPAPVFSIEHDPSQQKRFPCAVPDGNNMWMFWQGGNAGNWSIYYSWCNGGPTFDTTNSQWRPDLKLRTPDCLAAVGSPNPILRRLWADLRGSTSTNFTDPFTSEYNSAKNAFDVIYAGTNKITRNSDIMLSRYIAEPPTGNPNIAPSRTAQALPRVYNEKLARDPKLGFYTSQHIAWVRLKSGANPRLDNWGGYDPSNLPYVRVVFPTAYTVDSTLSLPAGTVISATDGSVSGAGGTPITPEIDTASGVYTYSYPTGSPADKVIGKMIVDFSSGIIRFQRPFKETATTVSGATSFSAPEVHADYTPQAWRLTTDSAVDGSPRAFIERTSMTDKQDTPAKPTRVTPGLDPDWLSSKPAPVDRLWVFWRKTGAAIENSTIFYTTMRIGIDLTKLGLPPIPMDPLNGTILPAAFDSSTPLVANALGPWEVDRTGTKIYLSEVDERYQSLTVFPGAPGPIHIHYKDGNGTPRDKDVADVTWMTELPEQSLGFTMDANVNEGSIYAFADPQPQLSGTSVGVRSSKIWVFWTSTRGGNSDLFWETLSPNFWGR